MKVWVYNNIILFITIASLIIILFFFYLFKLIEFYRKKKGKDLKC